MFCIVRWELEMWYSAVWGVKLSFWRKLPPLMLLKAIGLINTWLKSWFTVFQVVLDECSFLDNVANEYEGGPVSGCKDNVIESGSKYSGNVGGKRPWWYYAVVATAGGLSLLILCCGLCCCRILYKTIKKKVKKDRVYTDYAAMGATDSNAEDLNVVVQQRLQALHDSVEFDSSLRVRSRRW